MLSEESDSQSTVSNSSSLQRLEISDKQFDPEGGSEPRGRDH